MLPTQNLRVAEIARLLTPRTLKSELPVTEASNRTVVTSREAVLRWGAQMLGKPPPHECGIPAELSAAPPDIVGKGSPTAPSLGNGQERDCRIEQGDSMRRT